MADVNEGAARASLERVADEDGATVVRLSGELDISNVDAIRAELDPVVRATTHRLVLDLGELQFMDSSGIALLLQAAQRVPAVVTRNPTGIVERILVSSGVTGVLHLES